MLQVVTRSFTILAAAALCSCSNIDIKGLFVPTGDSVDSRFEQSAAMNADLKYATLETEAKYTFYVAADAHVDQTHTNLTRFNDAFRNDPDVLFGVTLGDCTDTRNNLPKYLEALSYTPERHTHNPRIFHLLGNHDAYFDGWKDFKDMIGPSVYWFETVFPEGKDLYISLDTATGTLGKKQTDWFKGFIEKNRSSYRHCTILTHTNFFYTDNSQAGSGNMPIEECFWLIDFLGRHNVSLVLQGHDHFREELTHRNVNYTVLGAIADKSESPEYLRIEVTSEGMKLDWHIIS